MAYEDLTQPMSLAGLSGSLNDLIGLQARSRQRGFQAATSGDFGDSLSEAMGQPDNNAMTEAMAENGVSVKSAPGLAPAGGEMATPGVADVSSLNGLSPDQLRAATRYGTSFQSLSPTQQSALNSVLPSRRALPTSLQALGS